MVLRNMWFTLAWQSLLSRKVSTFLTISALLVSVSLLFAIEHIRAQTQENFKRTVSGIDLVVAARSSQINVLLSSVFRIGANPNTVSWKTFQAISNKDKVLWSIPLSLGDSYQGFPVVGTNLNYFTHYQYGKKQPLTLQIGRIFARPNEAVIGASVARSLNLAIGQSIVISHGGGKVSFSHHEHHPMLITGILDATGTPVDKSVHVPLIAIEQMHNPATPASLSSSFSKPTRDNGSKASSSESTDSEHDHEGEHEHKVEIVSIPEIVAGTYDLVGHPAQISAFMLKAESPFAILTLQRDLNRYQEEAVSAIMPQVALAELWQTIGTIETIMQLIAFLVLCASLIGLITMLLASMHERRHEISVLRAIGASPWFIASLIQAEAMLIGFIALVGGYVVVTLSIYLLGGWLLEEYGLYVSANIYSLDIMMKALIVMVLAFVVAFIPAFTAYRNAKYLFR